MNLSTRCIKGEFRQLRQKTVTFVEEQIKSLTLDEVKGTVSRCKKNTNEENKGEVSITSIVLEDGMKNLTLRRDVKGTLSDGSTYKGDGSTTSTE